MTHSRVQKARTAGGRRAKGRPRVRTAKIAHRTQRQDVNRHYTHLQATSSDDRRPSWSDPQDVLPPGPRPTRSSSQHAPRPATSRGSSSGQQLRDAPGARRSRRRRRVPTATRPPPSPPRSRRQTGCMGSPAADFGDHATPRSQRRSRALPRTPRSICGRLPTLQGPARAKLDHRGAYCSHQRHKAAQTTRSCKDDQRKSHSDREALQPVHRHDMRARSEEARAASMSRRPGQLRSQGEGPRQARPTTPGDHDAEAWGN